MKRKHMFWMFVGCIVPIVAVVALLAAGVRLPGGLLLPLILLCPAMHLLMMRGAHGDHEHSDDHAAHEGAGASLPAAGRQPVPFGSGLRRWLAGLRRRR